MLTSWLTVMLALEADVEVLDRPFAQARSIDSMNGIDELQLQKSS
jgi:hypothetical protein